jgi:hypothetical protein
MRPDVALLSATKFWGEGTIISIFHKNYAQEKGLSSLGQASHLTKPRLCT